MTTVLAYQINNTELYMDFEPVETTEKAVKHYVSGKSGYKAFWIPKSAVKFTGTHFEVAAWLMSKFNEVK